MQGLTSHSRPVGRFCSKEETEAMPQRLLGHVLPELKPFAYAIIVHLIFSVMHW